MSNKLQHAGVVFLRTFLGLVGALHVVITASFGKEVGAAAIAGALAAGTDFIAHVGSL